MASCPRPSELIGFTEGGLEPAAAERLEAHLADCFDCQSAVASLLGHAAGPREQIADRYLLERLVGQGAHGEVWQAQDGKLGRTVAVKLLRERLSEEVPSVLRLLREARLLAQLSEPYVVRVYDGGMHAEKPYLVTEWLPGGDLAQWVSARTRSWREVTRVMTQAAYGLHAAHRHGVVHRDFKLSNVLLDEHGVARVADFGLARASPEATAALPLGPLSLTSWSQSGAAAGTPAYLAPEVFRGDEATPLSDQFSFCVSLYEALEGKLNDRRPFSSRTPAALRRIIQRGLEESPRSRFPDMKTLGDALNAALRERRRTLTALSAGAAVLAALGVGLGAPRLRHRRACGDDARRLEWPVTERDALLQMVGEAFRDSEAAARLSTRQIASFSQQWNETFAEACVSAAASGQPLAWSAQRECLRRQAQYLRSLHQLLASRSVKKRQELVEALAKVPRPADCQVTQARAPRAGEVERIAALGLDIARLEALRSTEDHAQAVAEAEAIVRAARTEGYAELEVEASLYLGTALYYASEEERAGAVLAGVVVLAERHGLDAIRLKALDTLAFLKGSRFGRHDEARQLLDQADAIAARLRAPPGELEDLAYTRAVLLYHGGQRDEAIALFEQILAKMEESGRRETVDYVKTLRLLARAHLKQHRAGKAVEVYRAGEPIVAAVLGERSLPYGTLLNDLGIALAGQGKLAEALRLLRRGASLDRELASDTAINRLITETNLAHLVSEVESLDEGLLQLEAAARSYASAYPQRPEMGSVALRWLAQASLHRGEVARALEHGTRLNQALKGAAPGSPQLARAGCEWGFVLLAAERRDEAQNVFQEVARQWTLAKGADGTERWCTDTGLLLLGGPNVELRAEDLLSRTARADTLMAKLYRGYAHSAVARADAQAGRRDLARARAGRGVTELEGLEGRRAQTMREALEALARGTLPGVPRVIP